MYGTRVDCIDSLGVCLSLRKLNNSYVQNAAFSGHVTIRQDGLAAVLVTDDGYPIRTAFTVLENTLNEFAGKFPNKDSWMDMTPEKTRRQYPELAKHLKASADPEKADPFFKIQKDLDETVGVVVRHCSRTRGLSGRRDF